MKFKLIVLLLVAIANFIVVTPVFSQENLEASQCSEHPCNGFEEQAGCTKDYYKDGQCCCACKETGYTCKNPSECCNRLCKNDECICRKKDEDCSSNNECCSGLCLGGTPNGISTCSQGDDII